MRTIKFRAWDKYTKTMFIACDAPICRLNDPSDGITYMQFTGLKDCKGKEIYENDLVKYKDRIWEVRYYYNGFNLFEKDSACANFDSWWNEVEVIGNIYEQK